MAHRQFFQNRLAFTLIELLVVVSLVMLLAVATVPVALSVLNGRSVREASSTIQAVVAGARDRATGANEPRGVRLITDLANPSLVREIRYIRPGKPLAQGSAIVVDATWNNPWNSFLTPFPVGATNGPTPLSSSWLADPPAQNPPPNPNFTMVVIMGVGNDWERLKSLPFLYAGNTKVYFGSIRFATAGKSIGFTTTDDMIAYTQNNLHYPLLRLDAPVARPIPYDDLHAGKPPYRSGLTIPGAPNTDDYLGTIGVNYTIPLGNVELEGETATQLPAGVVIDLGYIDPTFANPPDSSQVRLSRLNPQFASWDIMFSPNGAVLGNAATDATIFLWVREESAAVTDLAVPTAVAPSGFLRVIPVTGTGNHSLVAIISRNGLVRSADPNLGAVPSTAGIATVDASLTAGPNFEYWNPNLLYNLYFNTLIAPDGGETGL